MLNYMMLYGMLFGCWFHIYIYIFHMFTPKIGGNDPIDMGWSNHQLVMSVVNSSGQVSCSQDFGRAIQDACKFQNPTRDDPLGLYSGGDMPWHALTKKLG